jgi:S1-C subfamily serine protease
MNFTKKNFIILIITAITLIFALYSVQTSYSASPTDSSAFMNLQDEIDKLQSTVKKVSPSVVLIIAYDDTGEETGKRSGFFINTHGEILTNAAFLKDAYSAEVLTKSNSYSNVNILKQDEILDLTLIKVSTNNETQIKIDFDYKITPGEKVIAVGKSTSLKDTVSEGLVKSSSDEGADFDHIVINKTMPLTYFVESKDGPVINFDGKVIGVTTDEVSDHPIFGSSAISFDDKKINAISIHSIKQFLSAQNKINELPNAQSKIWSSWLKKQLTTAFIVLYGIGFPKMMAIVLGIIVFISLIQWLYLKLAKSLKK